MRFASLGSGSKGNATIIQNNETTIMVDCGFSVRETEKRLERLNQAPENIAALFVTHEHGDHIRGVGPFARKYKLPVCLTRGTARWNGLGNIPDIRYISVEDNINIGGFTVNSFPVPHDANEPCQFIIINNKIRFAMLTDVGHCTEHIKIKLKNCDALLLECNHDKDMLLNGLYPQSLKERVGGSYGHLSNQQASELLNEIQHDRLRKITIAHVSDKNNKKKLALESLQSVLLRKNIEITIIDQENGIDWQEI
ncbi:MAG: MBL fold metallo-hydrolase [Thiohalomonadales bacterium]